MVETHSQNFPNALHTQTPPLHLLSSSEVHHSPHHRHLLSVSPPHNMQTLHTTGQNSDYILGMSPGAFILLNICLGFVITVSLFIWICYRRRITSQLYNENPEQFAHLPELSSKQQKNLSKAKLEPLFGKPKIEKNQKDLNGINYTITFSQGEMSGVYFNHIQKADCYFEVEAIELNGLLQIGFVQLDSLEAVKEKAETMGSVGVMLSTNGFIVALGENVYNYGWNLQFGDVIGIALTQEVEQFNERRVWITKNGILLNRPPAGELGKWLATVEIKDSEREEYNMTNTTNTKQATDKNDGKNLNQEQLELQAAQLKAAQEKEENLLQQQRIALKTYKNFEFYAAIISTGVQSEGGKGKKGHKTKINLNVGGQIFRMQESFFKGGLLR